MKSHHYNKVKVQLGRELVPLIQMLFPALKAWDLHKPLREQGSSSPRHLRTASLPALDVIRESLAWEFQLVFVGLRGLVGAKKDPGGGLEGSCLEVCNLWFG